MPVLIIEISSPYDIPESDDWDLGKGEPTTPEQMAEIERVHAEMFREFHEQCADCGSREHVAGNESCPDRWYF